jgi:hypothetical protein
MSRAGSSWRSSVRQACGTSACRLGNIATGDPEHATRLWSSAVARSTRVGEGKSVGAHLAAGETQDPTRISVQSQRCSNMAGLGWRRQRVDIGCGQCTQEWRRSQPCRPVKSTSVHVHKHRARALRGMPESVAFAHRALFRW